MTNADFTVEPAGAMSALTMRLDSQHYGSYQVQYLGTVDIRHALPGHDRWWEKYHPARWFRGAALWCPKHIEHHREGLHPVVVSWGVWVATREANRGWKPIEGTPYLNLLTRLDMKAPKHAPFTPTDRMVAVWQRESSFCLVDNPDAEIEARAALSA
jgi:hypothetical protein